MAKYLTLKFLSNYLFCIYYLFLFIYVTFNKYYKTRTLVEQGVLHNLQ